MEENQPQQIQTPKPDKKEKKGCPLTLVIILAILAVGGIGFGIFELLINNNQPECILETIDGNNNQQQNEQNLEEKDDSENNQEEKTQQNNQTEENKERQASYEDLAGEELFTNVLNYQHDTYYNKYHKVLTITDYSSYYEQEKNEHYNVECKTKQCLLTNRENTSETIILTGFSGEIKDFFYAKFGQAGGSEQLLFLMADGSVEYMPIYDAFKKNNIKSYGKIEGLKNIANFQQLTSSSYKNNDELAPGSGQTVLAEDVDGNYYDLYYYLEEYM